MIILVVTVNFFFWRPMVAWAERFRIEESEAAERPKSIVFDVLRRSTVPGLIGRPFHPIRRGIDRFTRLFGVADRPLETNITRRRVGDSFFAIGVLGVIVWGASAGFNYLDRTIGFSSFPHVLWLGAVTFLRVVIIVIGATLVWVPVGVKIGLSPRLARYAQPIVQILASFPANFLFPFAAAFFVFSGISLNFGGIVLMALGAQWYILFNSIAGAMAIPTDLIEAMDNLGVHGWQRWKRLIIPAIFPAYVTGGITSAGGAWNASIVAEYVTYGHHTLLATGLGAYITQATADGVFPRVLMGIIVMAFYVVALNRLVWRRLYHLAETRYSL
jgi:NitT/TauT family transport system permease protein